MKCANCNSRHSLDFADDTLLLYYFEFEKCLKGTRKMAEKDFVEKRSGQDRRKSDRRKGDDQRRIALLKGENKRVSSRRSEDDDRRSGDRRKKQD